MNKTIAAMAALRAGDNAKPPTEPIIVRPLSDKQKS
jgi:hypothetical protein